jgi:hypothetical protein
MYALRQLLVVFTLLFVGLGSVQAVAAECDNAERMRLEEEMRKLSQRNAWSGVERSYEKLEGMGGCVLPFDIHHLGAESARYLGKVWEQYQRLSRAKELDPKEVILDGLMGIDNNYGRIDIKGSERRPPELTRAAMPFAPDQRKAIEWAQTVIANTGKFHGMLPAGDYQVAAMDFNVAAGQGANDEFPLVDVTKVKVKPVKGEGRPPGQGLIVYKGPIASVGPSFLTSSEPGQAVNWAGGASHQYEPASVGFASGLQIEAGGEVGFTKEFGVALSASYSGTYGKRTFHWLSGWLAAAVRPGDARFAIGPTWGVMPGSGTGVASWFDINHDQLAYPNDQLGYYGFTFGPGLKFSGGYGLVDWEPLQGVVELSAAFQHDGNRAYLGFGLRVGIVPIIKRFKG